MSDFYSVCDGHSCSSEYFGFLPPACPRTSSTTHGSILAELATGTVKADGCQDVYKGTFLSLGSIMVGNRSPYLRSKYISGEVSCEREHRRWQAGSRSGGQGQGKVSRRGRIFGSDNLERPNEPSSYLLPQLARILPAFFPLRLFLCCTCMYVLRSLCGFASKVQPGDVELVCPARFRV